MIFFFFTFYYRTTIVINLDFANDTLPYECAINVCDLISVTDVMDTFNLGPNGGMYMTFYSSFFKLNIVISIYIRIPRMKHNRYNLFHI